MPESEQKQPRQIIYIAELDNCDGFTGEQPDTEVEYIVPDDKLKRLN